MSETKNSFEAPLQKASFLGVLIGIALVILGWTLIPTTDLPGGGFFHLLLGPILATIMGAIGNVNYDVMKTMHHIVPVLAVVAMGIALYLMSGRTL